MIVNKKTGIAMGLLLLPVFLYLLVSIPIKPNTKVPNEYKKSVKDLFTNQHDIFKNKVSLVFFPSNENQFICLEKMIYFDQLFDNKFSTYQMLVYSSDSVFDKAGVTNNELSEHVLVAEVINAPLYDEVIGDNKNNVFLLIDSFGELRGRYLLDDDKGVIQARTEFFILLKDL